MINKEILHYKILEKLGQGGMGIVYKAEDKKLKREVAIKFLPKYISANEEERERFEIEAQAAAALNHPNITHIYAIEETDTEMFIVMELINGIELKEKIENTIFEEDEVLTLSKQIAEGLKAAHKKGIVHRDIKSSNIMLTDEGKIKIMDFGLAKIGNGNEEARMDSTIGTVAYMSPEQASGSAVDERSDIWSFGVVLYEMLTKELPFRGAYDQAVIYSILNEAPQSDSKLTNNKVFEQIIYKALTKDFNGRYKKIDEILLEIDSLEKSKKGFSQLNVKEIKKLAILPFANIMDDPQTNFLGFALADQIIGAMAYSKNVLVRPSSSIRKYQNTNTDVKTIASSLDVNIILTGNFLKDSDKIRLNIELVDVFIDQMIWREAIQLQYKNIFELQDIVSQKVVSELKIQFSPEERELMKPKTPQNQLAYEFYLRALACPNNIEGNKKAIETLNDSIKLDSTYAQAYMELGSRYNQLSQVGSNTASAQDKATQAYLKALSLNENLLPALASLGMHYTDVGKHEEAHSMLIRAIKLNSNDAYLHFSLSYHYRYIGFLDESKMEADIALSIDPKNSRFRSSIITDMYLGYFDDILNNFSLDVDSPFTLNYLGEVAYRAGKEKKAIEYFEKVQKLKDEVSELYFATSFLEFMRGNIESATEYNLKRELENPADSEIFYEIARIYGLLNKPEDCYRALRKSIDLGYVNYPCMQTDSFLNVVRYNNKIMTLLEHTRQVHEELKIKLVTSY